MNWHSAVVWRGDHPDAAWCAEIYPDDDAPVATAWRTEAAAKRWVRAQLAFLYGIERKRLPWDKWEYGSRLHWSTKGEWDDDSFVSWGAP